MFTWELEVFARAKEIVSNPPTKVGYGDIGDVLVDILREEIGSTRALQRLDLLQQGYAQARRNAAKIVSK